jgi:hypothetical protein
MPILLHSPAAMGTACNQNLIIYVRERKRERERERLHFWVNQ